MVIKAVDSAIKFARPGAPHHTPTLTQFKRLPTCVSTLQMFLRFLKRSYGKCQDENTPESGCRSFLFIKIVICFLDFVPPGHSKMKKLHLVLERRRRELIHFLLFPFYLSKC